MDRNIRYGRQDAPVSYILPYQETRGQVAIDLYEKANYSAFEWQKRLIYAIMAIGEDGLWTHSKFGLAVPRRNGKNEIITMREMAGLLNGEQILHTAHRTDTAHVGYERLLDRLEKAHIKIKSRYKAYGKEKIELSNGGRCDFRTRTSSGGLGTGYDLMIIDEAQEYTVDQESSLKYVISSSKNPQTILTGTPPTMVSKGSVFKDLRKEVLKGEREYCGWAEWSVEDIHDVHDKEAWYECNPSLGMILTERIIADEITEDDLDFNIQRLGYWTTSNIQSEISANEWDSCKVDILPKFTSKLFVAIKCTALPSTTLSIGVRTEDEKKHFIESYDCRNTRDGFDWILQFLSRADIENVVIDGKGDADVLCEEIKRNKIPVKVIRVSSNEFMTAMSLFRNAITNQTVMHTGQLSLKQSVTNCEKRAIGTAGGYGFKSLKLGVDVSLLETVALAYWACDNYKPRKKQQVHY